MKPAIPIALLLFCASPSDAQDDLRAKVQAVYDAGGYARELPGRETPSEADRARAGRGSVEIGPPSERTRSGRRIVTAPPPESTAERRSPFGSLVSVLPWIGVGAIAIIILLWHFLSRRDEPGRERREAQGVVGTSPSDGDSDALRTPASELAAQGRYAEAIHALLLEAIDRIAAAAARAFAPSLTSRELGAEVALGADARSALGRLVQAVEVSRFGGRPAGAAEFDSCAALLEKIVT